MTPNPDFILLQQSLHSSAMVIMSVTEDHADATTPCESWTVSDLVNHLLNDLTQFEESAKGGALDYSTPAPQIDPSEWATTLMTRAMSLIEAWKEAEDTSGLGMQIAEISVHTWDLARAIDMPADVDDAVAQRGLDWMTESLKPEFRGSEADGKSFGPEQEAPADAPAIDRLAAFSGRPLD